MFAENALEEATPMALDIRDRHGASRAVAYLQFAGSPFVVLTGVILPENQPLPILAAILIVAATFGVGGWMTWSRPEIFPDSFWWIAPLFASFVITGLNLMTKDASTGSQLFYLWPVLYAANFLSPRSIYLNIVAVLLGEGMVLIVALAAPNGFADWISMGIALSMTAVVVKTLRDRADRLRQRLEGQALADSLTGLANRRAFDEALQEAGEWASANGRPLTVVTLDLDYFKTVNDTYGHGAGDQALQLVADAMRKVAGPGDVTARLGGDEFVMLLRADQQAALRTVDQLRSIVGADTTLPSGAPGLSVGVAVMPTHADTVDELVRASDKALYTAKSGGRGRVALAGTRTVSPAPPRESAQVR
jgi:diguanylate cyclase (GGDEF)-like protein